MFSKTPGLFGYLSACVYLLFGAQFHTSGQLRQLRLSGKQAPVSSAKKPSSASDTLRWQPKSPKARHKLDAAERIMSHSRPSPPIGGSWEESGTLTLWEKAKEPIKASLAIEPSGRGSRDMGEFYLRSGDYKEAIVPLTEAVNISPRSTNLSTDLKQTLPALRIATRAQHLLPQKQRINKVFPFPVKRRRLWAVLSSEVPKDQWGATSENVLVSVFHEHGNHLSLLWRSQVSASEEHRGYFRADLWVFPMTGRKLPELVFMGVCVGGSANPTRMQIYHWTGRTFREVLDADSEEQPLWIDDLRHTGRYQVRCVHLVGKDVGHSAQVRWASIYDWNGRQFVEANEKYPEAFRKTKQEILTLLPSHPQDPVLLKYLAKAYRHEGRRRLALVYLHRMERVCAELVKEDPADIDSWWNLGESAEQTGHRARAAQCFGKAQRISRALAKKEADPEDRDYYLDFAKEASARIIALHRPAKR